MARTLKITAGLALALVALLAFVGYRYVRFESVPEPTLPGKLERASLSHEGRERTFLYYRPAQLAPRPAVVFVLHGSMGDGAQARAMMAYEFDMLAEDHGFLAVYPDGFEGHWHDCRAQGPYAANRLGIDDVGFFRKMVEGLAERHDVDRGRVFATGVSNGGQMALRLALEAPDLVAGVAPIAASLPSGDNLGCRPAGKPVPFLLINGTADPMNPYEGGKVALYGIWGNRGNVHSTQKTVEYWRELAGLDGAGEVQALPDVRDDDGSHVERTRWSAPGKPEVVLYAVHGGGHTVPHPLLRMPRFVGPTNGDVNSAQLIWDFFSRTD